MPYSYTEIGAVQSRQDSVAISLGPIVVHSDAEVFYGAHFPYGLSVVATNLMCAAYHGVLGGGGEKTIGSWASGNSVVSGSSGGSSRLAQWARGIFGTDVIEGAWGSASGSSGKFRFTVPAPPAGYSLYSAQVRIWASGYTNVSVEKVTNVGVGTFEYDCPIYSGAVTIEPCHELIENYFSGGWYVMNGYLDSQGWNTNIWDEGGSLSASTKTYSAQIEIVYFCEDDEDDGSDAINITDTEADLTAYNDCEEAWFEYQEKNVAGHIDTPHQYTQGLLTFHLTGLKPDTWYWYQFIKLCNGVRVEGKIYWFKTKPAPALAYTIITLPATEVWTTGATIHGMLEIAKNDFPRAQYLYLGFQYGKSSTECAAAPVVWCYSGNYYALSNKTNRYPIQMTIAGLLPDSTYYYRACLHVGTPPMNVNNYYGATLSFGGPVSMFGFGREYVTAKKAEDDISRMAAGRYYMDKEGVFQYESYQRRKTA